jgi:regulator of sigma E protease
MFAYTRDTLVYLIDLGVLVFFHELGHYLAARSQGVVVEAFSIGFGPALLSWRAKSGTVWKISALPLGGYVKMQGWGEPGDGGPALPGSFSATSLRSKALIVAAGPAANILLAFVLFAGLFMFAGKPVVQPVLSSIVAGGPAATSGLQAGDRVLRIGAVEITDFTALQTIVTAHPDTAMDFTINRHGQVVSQNVTIGDTLTGGVKVGHLGVIGSDMAIKRYGPLAAISVAGQEVWNDITGILSLLYQLVVHHQGIRDLAGPLGIAQITGKVAAMGFISVVSLVALLSVNLGLVNLIPIPILDGGHLMYYLAEAIYGRPLPPRAQEIGFRLGGAIILSLLFVTTFNDLSRWGAVSWVAHLFG